MEVMKLTKTQKQQLADTLKDGANVVLAGLMVGGFVEGKLPKLYVPLGLILYVCLIVLTLQLRKRG